jgi:16S rRNA A1518/A1519 N6-dimethyltransferase RsmA/KsgA/DIM1 with predicted DNA glycosylase/AP lyase activity
MMIDPEGRELQELLARLPPVPHCRVVEIGCGDGRLTRRYADRVGSVLAIEPDEALTAAYRAGGVESNVDLRTLSVDALDLSAGSADAVLFSWAL